MYTNTSTNYIIIKESSFNNVLYTKRVTKDYEITSFSTSVFSCSFYDWRDNYEKNIS